MKEDNSNKTNSKYLYSTYWSNDRLFYMISIRGGEERIPGKGVLDKP